MKKPVNQATEILYELIVSRSRLSFSQLYSRTHIVGISQRISDLRRHGLNIYCVEVKVKNKHGREVSYGTWSILEEYQKAIEVYNALNKNGKEDGNDKVHGELRQQELFN